MIRLVCLVLVSWGLIVQPVMAGAPTKMIQNTPETTAVFNVDHAAHADEHGDHHDQKVSESTEEHCHDGAAGSTSDTCLDCASYCMTGGVCGSCCGYCGASANHKVILSSGQQISASLIGKAEDLVLGFLSSIYHPPKRS